MGELPKATRATVIKCIDCNAPVVATIEGTYVCTDCGGAPLEPRTNDRGTDEGGTNVIKIE